MRWEKPEVCSRWAGLGEKTTGVEWEVEQLVQKQGCRATNRGAGAWASGHYDGDARPLPHITFHFPALRFSSQLHWH